MHLLDWAVLAAYALCAAAAALWFARRGEGGHSGDEYMVAGRRLPWWVVGVSDVATGDGADAFWVFVFFVGGFQGYHRFFWISSVVSMSIGVVWARYWRRLRLSSPGQLIEERYGGGAAAILRAVSTGYAALVTGGVLLGYVLRGFAQSMRPFLGWPDDVVLLVFCGAALAYTLLSGLVAVAYTDLAHFALMMVARAALAAVLLGAAGGLGAVLDRVEQVRGPAFLQPWPPSPGGVSFGEFTIEPLSLLALLLMGALSGASGRGAAAQRTLAAKDERHAALGELFAAALSLVVRVLPLALVGLVAVATLDPARRDTDLWADLVRRHAPPGLLGLLLCGVISGYVATIDGLVNFGAAGLLNDVYRRHLRPDASERAQVAFGRLASVLVIGVAYLWARVLIARVDAAWINFINSVAGLVLLPTALLRWMWWRTTVAAEIVAFVASFPMAYVVWFGAPRWPLSVLSALPALHALPSLPAMKDQPFWHAFLVLGGAGALLVVVASLLTRPAPLPVLRHFFLRARPPGRWGPVLRDLHRSRRQGHRAELRNDLLTALACMALCAALVVGLGAALGRRGGLALAMAALSAGSGLAFYRLTLRGERLRAASPPEPSS